MSGTQISTQTIATGLVEDALSALRNPLEASCERLATQRDYVISVAPSNGTLGKELRARLGETAAEQLVETWRNRSLLDLSLETETEIKVFSRSNKMARNQYYDQPGERVTQEDYVQSAGCKFAREAAAILLCARLVERARNLGVDLSGEPIDWAQREVNALRGLSKEDVDLLTRLKLGVMRTRSGAVGIDASGHLRALSFFPEEACPNAWVLAEKL